MNLSATTVTCPACKKSGDWFATPWGPFCSQRCKLVDLGKWLGGEHAICEPLRPEHLEQSESLSPDKLADPKEEN
jgi:uncharacterized protein